MNKGIIIKGIGGFYFVASEEGTVRAKGRGAFKKEGLLLTVGDEVLFTPAEGPEDDAVIEKVLPRKNRFHRPPIANVDLLIVVMAAADPDPNLTVADKLLVMAEKNGVRPAVCISKSDLVSQERAEELADVYRPVYPTVLVSGKTGAGAEKLKELISGIPGTKAALAGPSGVGKSTLTNLLIPGASMETGTISGKTGRGRHTTRHVEIFPCGDGYLFDTPGFTSFDLAGVEEEELAGCFPEIARLAEECRFDDCRHMNEPDCAVTAALKDGRLSKSRYSSYVTCLKEIRENKAY